MNSKFTRSSFRFHLFTGGFLLIASLVVGFVVARLPFAQTSMPQSITLAAPALQEDEVEPAEWYVQSGGEIISQDIGSPSVFNYSGFLRGVDGSALNGNFTLKVGIYSTATGGLPMWSQTYADHPVHNGYYNILIGAQTAIGTTLDDGPRFLGIIINDREEISPREELLAVPWAINAFEAWEAEHTGSAITSVLANNVGSAGAAIYALGVNANMTTYVASTDTQYESSTKLSSWQSRPNGAMCWLTSIDVFYDLAPVNCFVDPGNRAVTMGSYGNCSATCFNYGN